jgi:hypothetical protein
MSRIILERYSTGEEHIVVGWDRPLHTFYWQEFNKEPRNPVTGDVEWDSPEGEEWEEMLGFAGYEPNELTTTAALYEHAAKHNEAVHNAMAFHEGGLVKMLDEHSKLEYPDSNISVDLSYKYKEDK